MRLVYGMVLCAALAVLGAAPAAAQTGNDLFQQALVKERADGDVRGAIQLYERIVREFARDRALAARALVQAGRCYERLGNQNAQRAYRRVVQQYPDQADMVQEARARLTALGAGPAAAGSRTASGGVTLREIKFDGLDTPWVHLSPDGAKVVYVHTRGAPPRNSIRVRTLASGEEVSLMDTVGLYADFQWSPDGSQIAYGTASRELIVIGAAGGPPRVVWTSPVAGAMVTPLDWSPDGGRILVSVRNQPQWSIELVILSLSGGGAAPRTLRSGRAAELDGGQFSPDGAYVAGIQRGNVYVWSVDGRQEIRVTTDSAAAPFWSPDGRFLVFESDRSGDKDVWAVPMERGAPSGPPVRVRAGLGRRAMSTEMTASGGLSIVTYGEGAPNDLFVLDVGPAEGGAAGAFRPVARYPTQHFQPRWSPDGRRFAYTSRKGEVSWPRIFVGLGAGQQDVELPMRDHYPANVEWGRDGESVIFPGWRRQDGRVGIFRLSLLGQTIEPLQLGDPPGPRLQGAFVNLVWLPAAGRYFVQRSLGPKRYDFYVMEADGSGLRRTADSVPANYWAWPSPDGRYVAYRDERSLHLMKLDDRVSRSLGEWQDTTWFDVTPGWSRDGRYVAWSDRAEIRIFDTQDGTARSLIVAPAGSQIVAPPAWAPDGSHVAYVVRDTASGASSRLDEVWLVPSAGGSPRRIALAPDTHPRLRLETWLSSGALAAGGSQRLPATGVAYRHWLLEGFLPEVAGVRRR